MCVCVCVCSGQKRRQAGSPVVLGCRRDPWSSREGPGASGRGHPIHCDWRTAHRGCWLCAHSLLGPPQRRSEIICLPLLPPSPPSLSSLPHLPPFSLAGFLSVAGEVVSELTLVSLSVSSAVGGAILGAKQVPYSLPVDYQTHTKLLEHFEK